MKIMKLKKYTLLVIATIALFGLVGWSGYAQKKSSNRVAWEYKEVVKLSEPQVNVLGAEGWEMIGFSVDSNTNKFMYFKWAK
jgi:hypothetical protein